MAMDGEGQRRARGLPYTALRIAASERIRRVLWNDPATGVMRHADAGYDIALECARKNGLNLPGILG